MELMNCEGSDPAIVPDRKVTNRTDAEDSSVLQGNGNI